MEYREGKGMVLVCQMDVTGRSDDDPAALTLMRNIFEYVGDWKPAPARKAVYVGEPGGRRHLEDIKVALSKDGIDRMTPEDVLVVGPGGGEQLAGREKRISGWIKAGGRVLALGLDEKEANAFLSDKISMKREEHIAAFFEPPGMDSMLAGV